MRNVLSRVFPVYMWHTHRTVPRCVDIAESGLCDAVAKVPALRLCLNCGKRVSLSTIWAAKHVWKGGEKEEGGGGGSEEEEEKEAEAAAGWSQAPSRGGSDPILSSVRVRV